MENSEKNRYKDLGLLLVEEEKPFDPESLGLVQVNERQPLGDLGESKDVPKVGRVPIADAIKQSFSITGIPPLI